MDNEIEIPFVDDAPERKLKWHEKIIQYFLLALFALVAVVFIKKFCSNRENFSAIRKRLRYFNPTVTETFWGKRVTWTGRQNPLTDEELDNFLK